MKYSRSSVLGYRKAYAILFSLDAPPSVLCASDGLPLTLVLGEYVRSSLDTVVLDKEAPTCLAKIALELLVLLCGWGRINFGLFCTNPFRGNLLVAQVDSPEMENLEHFSLRVSTSPFSVGITS